MPATYLLNKKVLQKQHSFEYLLPLLPLLSSHHYREVYADWQPWRINIFLMEPHCRHSCRSLNIIRALWTVMPGLAWTATGRTKYLTSRLQRGDNKSCSDSLWNPEAWRGAEIYVFFYIYYYFAPLFFSESWMSHLKGIQITSARTSTTHMWGW